jgi:hypothetical protein
VNAGLGRIPPNGESKAQDDFIRFLSHALEETEDPVERYWTYTAMGRLTCSHLTLKVLAHHCEREPDEFARRGAREALTVVTADRDRHHA